MKRLALGLVALALAACGNATPSSPAAGPGGPDLTKVPDYTPVAITPFLGQPVLGRPDAPVTLVEYASTACSHCKAFHDEVFPELKAKYIDAGKVKLHFIMLPTQPEAVSVSGAALARCVSEDRYFDVVDALFDEQEALVESVRKRLPGELLQRLAAIGARHGLTTDQARTCLDSEEIFAVTAKGVEEAPKEITGTPSFVLDGKVLKVESWADLTKALDEAVASTATGIDPAGPRP